MGIQNRALIFSASAVTNREREPQQVVGPKTAADMEPVLKRSRPNKEMHHGPTEPARAAGAKGCFCPRPARTRLRSALTGRILFSEPFAISSHGSTKYTMTDDDERELQTELARLQQEHRDLDAAIDALHQSPAPDLLRLQRLKKRKLQLRDRIAFIEDQITPDIIA
jgi:hypothetical protein